MGESNITPTPSGSEVRENNLGLIEMSEESDRPSGPVVEDDKENLSDALSWEEIERAADSPRDDDPEKIKKLRERMGKVNKFLDSDNVKEVLTRLVPRTDEESDEEYRIKALLAVKDRLAKPGRFEKENDELSRLLIDAGFRSEVVTPQLLQAVEALYYLDVKQQNEKKLKEWEKSQQEGKWEMGTFISLQRGVVDVGGSMSVFEGTLTGGKRERKEAAERDMRAAMLLSNAFSTLPYEKIIDSETGEERIVTFQEKMKPLLERRRRAEGSEKENITLQIRKEYKGYLNKLQEAMRKREWSTNPFSDDELFQKEAYEQLQGLKPPFDKEKFEKLIDLYSRTLPERLRESTKSKLEDTFRKESDIGALPDFLGYAQKGLEFLERRMELLRIPKPKIIPIPEKIYAKKWVEIDREKKVWKVQGEASKDALTSDEGGGEEEELKPAPVEEEKPPSPKPAPLPEGENDTLPDLLIPGPGSNATPLPDRLVLGVVAMKQRIGEKDSMEVMEARAREIARKKIDEDREKYRGLFGGIKGFIPRLWKHSIGYAATYSKEKSFAIQAMAEAGVQLTGLPYEFLKELEDTARSDLSKRRKGFLGLKKVAGAVADLFHEASFTQKALHKEELELLRKLRKAAFEGNANGLSDELLDSYKKILLGDYQASEALARKISHEQGDEIIREAVGEKRSGEIDLKETPLGDFLGNFLKDEVIRPLLKEGLMNDGKISEETLFKVRGKIQGFFFSKEFINWYDSLEPDVRDKLDLSTSYGLDIVPFVQEVLLPTLIKAREHYKDMDNLDEYIDKLVLKTRLGTVEGGPKGIIGEGLLEKASSRAITNERVMKLYEEIKSNEKIELIPDGYLSLSGRRATILGKVAAPLATHITLGVGVGLGLYLTKTWAKKFGRVLVPVAGGTIVSGVVRSFEEWGRIGREWEEHMVDTELGYTFDKEKSGKVLPNRREQLDKTIYSMKRISDLATPLRGYLKEESLKDDDIEKMLGIIADAQARIELSDSLGYGLLSASNPQSYQTEMTDLEIALAEAKVMLKNKYSKEVERVFLKSTKGLRVKGEDKVGKIILALVDAQEFHLQKGAEFDPKFQSILRGVKIEKAESIEARKSAFRKLRARRVINSLAVTALGGLGVYGGEKLLKWGLNEALSNGWLPHSVIKHFTRIEKVKSPTSHVEKPTHVSTEIIKTDKGGLKLNLPKGYDVKSVDSVHHSIMISTPGEGDKVINYTVDSKGIPHLGDISKLGEGFKVREVSGKQEYIPKMIYSGITRTDFSGVIKDGHLSIELPPGYHESINGNELIITDDNHVKHVFNIVKDSHGKVIGIKGDPRSELKFHLGRPRITYESVHTKLGEQAVKIHEFISNGGLEKHHMIEVGRPAKVDFHVLWPEHARLTGEHAGHELEMHWGDGLNHTTGKWFKEKGVINFAGTINKHAVNPYLKGLSPRHDKVLEHLIDLAPDHKIDHQDMFVIMVTRTGKRIYAPLDKSGNFVLPEELRDPDNPYRPNPNFFKWIGIGVLEKKDHIISASEWLKKGGEPSMVTGAHEHILASLGLKGDVLPPVTEKKTIDLSFSLQKQLYEEKKVLIDVRVANIRRVVETSEVKERIVPPRVSWPDFALFVMPRRPLEAPIGVVDKSVGKKPLFKETGKTTPSTSTPPVVYDEDHKEEWRRRWLDHFTDDYVQRIKKATEDKDIRSLADQLGISEDKVKRLRDGENNEEEIRRAIRQPIVGFVSRAEFLNLYRDELKTRLEEDVKESLGEDEKEKYEKFEKVILYIMINKSLFSALSGGEIGNYLKEVFPDLFETDDKIDEFLKFFVKNIKEKANNSVIRFIKDKNDDYSKLISEYSS